MKKDVTGNFSFILSQIFHTRTIHLLFHVSQPLLPFQSTTFPNEIPKFLTDYISRTKYQFVKCRSQISNFKFLPTPEFFTSQVAQNFGPPCTKLINELIKVEAKDNAIMASTVKFIQPSSKEHDNTQLIITMLIYRQQRHDYYSKQDAR